MSNSVYQSNYDGYAPIRSQVSDERGRNNANDMLINKNVDDKVEDFDEPSKTYPVNNCSKYILIAGVTIFLTILVLIYNSHTSYSELEDGTIDAVAYNMTNTPSVTPTRITKSPLSRPSTYNPSFKPSNKPSARPSKSPVSGPTKKPTKAPTSYPSTDMLKFTFKRENYDILNYFDQDNPDDVTIQYAFLTQYTGLLEPAVNNNLVVFSASDEMKYSYSVCSVDDDTDCQYGVNYNSEVSAINVNCEVNTVYTVTVNEVDTSKNATVRSSTGNVICYYVRRELRDLTADDLSTTMDTYYSLWQYSEEEGQQLYGSNFHNATYFTSAHYFGASQREADHIHEGLGFLLLHLQMSNIFELSLQAVNPAVTLPYWDYTRDDSDVTKSYAFTADTFGSLNSWVVDDSYDIDVGWSSVTNDINDARILDGRWANLKTDYNSYYSDMKTAYGYFRAPWNMNPSPYLTRFTGSVSWPTCSSFYTWIKKKTDLMAFLKYAPGPAHASVHGTIGGVYGCNILYDKLVPSGIVDANRITKLCANWGFKLKDLYRTGYITAYDTDDCTVNNDDLGDSDCGFVCDESKEDDFIAEIQDSLSGYVNTSDYNALSEIHKFICHGDGYKVFYGDHLESASAADPSFWTIHPTSERVLQARSFLGWSNTDWNYQIKVPTEYVCERPKCYHETSDNFYFDTQCCMGHFENDTMIDFVNSDSQSMIKGGRTNREYITQSNPANENYNMGYIYESFLFPGCSDSKTYNVEGYISDLIDGLVSDDTGSDDASSYDASYDDQNDFYFSPTN